MRLLRVENDKYVFRLGKGERELLAIALSLYPAIPAAHQVISKSQAIANKTNQHLLDEALAEQRRENKKRVAAFLADAKRFHETETSTRVTLTGAEIEWLLQVLNDVHVGSWILLGSPDESSSELIPTDKNVQFIDAMELARWFQSDLLRAFSEKP
ncbi:MAG TPA: hypothetical protein VGI88_05205 [Verrucomicrobiae bacterium]